MQNSSTEISVNSNSLQSLDKKALQFAAVWHEKRINISYVLGKNYTQTLDIEKQVLRFICYSILAKKKKYQSE